MRKLSRSLSAMLCAVLAAMICAVPASAAAQEETMTRSLDVMLVVDDTVSMQSNDPNHIASLALEKFTERIPGEGSRIGMATYDDDILTKTEPSMMLVRAKEDKDKLKEFARTGLTQDGRFTDLPGALFYAVEQIRGLPESDNKPAIIAVSDGENDFINAAARARSDEALEKVKAADIPVYLIVINASNTSGVREYMEGIAEDTKGKAVFVNSGDDVDLFLLNTVNELFGLIVDPENQFFEEVGPEPKEWTVPLSSGVFEANLELTHKAELQMELFGPDGAQIPLKGGQDVATSTMQDRDMLKTLVRLREPDEGNYTMKMSSPGESQLVIGEIILNNEIRVEVDISHSPAQKGDSVEVTASLMRGGKQYTDLEFSNLSASVTMDGGQPEEMELDGSANIFRCKLTVPDQGSDPQVVVTVQGKKTFLRSSDPVTLVIDQGRPIPSSSQHSSQVSNPPDPPKPGDVPIWLIIAAVVLLVIIVLTVVVLVLRSRGRGISGSGGQYIRLQGTLTVTYLDNMRQHIWEDYIHPGRYYTKRSPQESLGKMLRDQQNYNEIPAYFDKIQIAGLQYSDGRLCVEVTGEVDTPAGPEKINQHIDVENGRGMNQMDDMSFFGGMSSAVIVFPDGNQVELSFRL